MGIRVVWVCEVSYWDGYGEGSCSELDIVHGAYGCHWISGCIC